MKFARLSITLSIFALFFTGCSSQTADENSTETKNVVQQSPQANTKQDSTAKEKPSHDAKYQPLPKDYDSETYNITGLFDIEVKKAKRQVENGIYIPKKRIDFKTVEGIIEGSNWTIQRVIVSDYCIEVRTIRGSDGRKFTWFLYDNASWFGIPQSIIYLGGFDVKDFEPTQLHPSKEGSNGSIALVAAHKVFNQYGANYKDDAKFDNVVKQF